MAKKPVADEGQDCPLWKEDVSLRCHRCNWYIQLRGTNPNTGQEIDEWGCSIPFNAILLVENAQQARQTGAAVESLRNEIVKREDSKVEAMRQLFYAPLRPQRLLEQDDDGRK